MSTTHWTDIYDHWHYDCTYDFIWSLYDRSSDVETGKNTSILHLLFDQSASM